MDRIVIPLFALTTAAAIAVPFAIFAHDELGIAVTTIRTDALAGAGGILFVII